MTVGLSSWCCYGPRIGQRPSSASLLTLSRLTSCWPTLLGPWPVSLPPSRKPPLRCSDRAGADPYLISTATPRTQNVEATAYATGWYGLSRLAAAIRRLIQAEQRLPAMVDAVIAGKASAVTILRPLTTYIDAKLRQLSVARQVGLLDFYRDAVLADASDNKSNPWKAIEESRGFLRIRPASFGRSSQFRERPASGLLPSRRHARASVCDWLTASEAGGVSDCPISSHQRPISAFPHSAIRSSRRLQAIKAEK